MVILIRGNYNGYTLAANKDLAITVLRATSFWWRRMTLRRRGRHLCGQNFRQGLGVPGICYCTEVLM